MSTVNRSYSQYVAHCLRFYARYPKPQNSGVAQTNWLACEKALRSFSIKEKAMILAIYNGRDAMADMVYETAKAYEVPQETVWKLIKILERKVAEERGLL